MHEFIKALGDYIDKLQSDEPLYQFIVTGDFNISLLDMDDISTSLIDTYTFRAFLQVAIPTHITLTRETLIDHVYTKLREKSTTNVIMSGISDHEMTLTEVSTKISRVKSRLQNAGSKNIIIPY